MIEDPEFAAALEKHRARIRADRDRQDEDLAELIARFAGRGGPYRPQNLPAVDTRDFKQAQSGER